MSIIRTLMGLALCLVLSACGEAEPPAADQSNYVTDVPALREEMLQPAFWVGRLKEDRVRLDGNGIQRFNVTNFARDGFLHNLDEFPESIAREKVLSLIDKVSRPASASRYYADGRELGEQDYAALEAAVQRDTVAAEVSVQWGLVVQRASMRSYPTSTSVFKNMDDRDLDRFQETGVFPGQRIAILHESADGQWWFAINYHYAAWVPKAAVAIGERQAVERWHGKGPRLTVTGAQVRANYNPADARTSELLLDMGVSLPLLTAEEVGHNVHGQNPSASYVVELPVRETDGSLAFAPTLIARSRDVTVGFPEFRSSAILRQAFKFLGERYGWGHDYNGRDCTGFVGEVYKSFGIYMPRNSGQQGHSAFAPTVKFSDEDAQTRLDTLLSLRIGDLIYIPGHVMMYIGQVDGEPYVIHDVTGLSYITAEGKPYRGTLSGVSVTPLSPLRFSSEKSFIESIYAIKTII